MWEWLLWGHPPKPKTKQLGDMVDRLLAAGGGEGENVFSLPEKELKRLCSAARWGGGPPRDKRGRGTRPPQGMLPAAQVHSMWELAAGPWEGCVGCHPRPAMCSPPSAARPRREALLKEPTLLDISAPGNVVVVGAAAAPTRPACCLR